MDSLKGHVPFYLGAPCADDSLTAARLGLANAGAKRQPSAPERPVTDPTKT